MLPVALRVVPLFCERSTILLVLRHQRDAPHIFRRFASKKLSNIDYPPPFLSIEDEQDAKKLIYFLNKSEREILFKTLNQHMTAGKENINGINGKAILTKEQWNLLFLANLLPFVGFGFLDNLLMIVAGEYIDRTLGIYLGISVMAAAALGNIISDVAGVGSAHYVEFLVARCGIKAPVLSAEQWASGAARRASNLGRCLGLIVGCLLGMFPLLFRDERKSQEVKKKGLLKEATQN